MKKQSAGILLYRFNNNLLEVFLVHPGGPFWQKKDVGAWSIPKGEFTDEEDPLSAAKREFLEETGIKIEESMITLSPIKQKSGKTVFAWAVEKNIDPAQVVSNTFEIEWPPKSGQIKIFPEIDKGEWFDIPLARQKFNEGQVALLEELIMKLNLTQEQIESKKNPQEGKDRGGSIQLDLF